MPVLYTNNATSTLSAGITNVATSLSVSAGQGARFPAISGSDYFYATLVNSSGTIEIVKVTARATDTLTIVRAQDGTTAVAWNAGDRIEVRVTKAMLDDLKADARAAAFTSNLTFSGTGLRITGDFDNATIANRVMVQTSTANGQTLFGLLPNGTAVNAQFHVWGASDPTNAPLGALIVNSTSVRLHSTASGTGTVLPLQFWMSASEAARFDTAGKFGLGQSSPAAKFDVSGNQAANIVAMAALDVDCSAGNFFTKTINANSTFTFSNAPASRAFAFTLELTHTSGTVTWPAAVVWPAGTAPTLTTGKVHLFTFVTDDGGTSWRGASQVNYNS